MSSNNNKSNPREDEDDKETWVHPAKIQSSDVMDGVDEEGWIPPAHIESSDIIGGTSQEDSSPTTSSPKSKRIETILEVSRQVKEQERLDMALEEAELEAESLFQLSEEEQETMTDEQILERLEEVLKREEELEEQMFQKELEREEERRRMEVSKQQQQQVEPPDWLRNRRAMLGEDGENDTRSTTSSTVPIIPNTLLTADEIILLLETHGGGDIVVIEDDPDAPRMGGADGMIFCTGGGSSDNSEQTSFINHSPHLISTLSRVLIDHMKDRDLHDFAPSTKQNTTHRAAISPPTIFGSGRLSNNPSESWRIVDCGNYIVHILDEETRWDLNLEDLWSGNDPLWNLNVFDDDAVEEYCEKHPVPESYNGTGSSHEGHYGDEAGELIDAAVMKRLERTTFGYKRRHKPVIPHATRKQQRRIGRQKRREQRQRDYFGSFD